MTTINPNGRSRLSSLSIKALEGYDTELETPIPYLPWMRLTFAWYHWNADELSNLDGLRGALFFYITDRFYIEAGRAVDNKFHNNFVRFSVNLYGDIPEAEYTLCRTPYTCEMFPNRNLACWTLAKVRRHNDVVVERVQDGVNFVMFC